MNVFKQNNKVHIFIMESLQGKKMETPKLILLESIQFHLYFKIHWKRFNFDPGKFILSNLYMSRVMRNPDFCICEKGADQLCSYNSQLISTFVFATKIVQPL